jgi:hypothetical protein
MNNIFPNKVVPYRPKEQDRSQGGSSASRPPWDDMDFMWFFVLHEERLKEDNAILTNRLIAARYPMADLVKDLQHYRSDLLEKRRKQRGDDTLTWESIAANARNRYYKCFWLMQRESKGEWSRDSISFEHPKRAWPDKWLKMYAEVLEAMGRKHYHKDAAQ